MSATTPWTVIESGSARWGREARELWRYRGLLVTMAMRDLRVRYKQSLLGAAWAVIPALATMVVFTALFTLLGKKPAAEGSVYGLSVFCAMLPWKLFADATAHSGNSLVDQANLIKKVYFPRLIVPLAPLLTALVDHAIAFAVLLALMAWHGVGITASMLTLPLWALLALAAAAGISLWLSALNALYRDVKYALPLLVQLGMYLSPVVYETNALIPERYRFFYSLNPMAGVIEGYRYALLGGPGPDPVALSMSVGGVAVLLLGGLIFFKRTERRFCDSV